MSTSSRAGRASRPRPSPRSRRHEPAEARREITESAVRFLWDHPFRDLTVGRVMADTTLSRPAFYQYFTDLHQLIEALLGEVEVFMHEAANPWISGDGEPISALKESLRGVVGVCVDHGPIVRAIAEAAPLDGRLERAWSAFRNRWDDAVAARIAAQQEVGLVPPLDPHRVARTLNLMDTSVLIAEFGRRPQGDPEAVLNTLHRVWVGTLYGQCVPSQTDSRTSKKPSKKRRRGPLAADDHLRVRKKKR